MYVLLHRPVRLVRWWWGGGGERAADGIFFLFLRGEGAPGVTLLHSTTPRIGVMSSTSRSGDLPAVPIAVDHALQVHYFIVSLVLAPQRLEHGI